MIWFSSIWGQYVYRSGQFPNQRPTYEKRGSQCTGTQYGRIDGNKERSWEGSLDYGSVARFVLSGDLIFKGATEATKHMGSNCVQQDSRDRDTDLVFQFHWEHTNLGRGDTDDGIPQEILTGLLPVRA